MAIINNYLSCQGNDELLQKILEKLNLLITQNQTIMGQMDDIKAKLALQDTAIDGLAGDLAFIKEKLAGAENGLTGAEVTELNTLIDARTAKLQALDAQTDPNATV
jgi:uncharacterized coiled-coil protein SlyX